MSSSWNSKLGLVMVMIVTSRVRSANAVTCYVCDSNTNNDCNPGTQTTCSTGQICMDEVRDENGLFIVKKMCKESNPCYTQAGQSSQCNPVGGGNSLCYYCCETDLCNSDDYLDATVAPATTRRTTDRTTLETTQETTLETTQETTLETTQRTTQSLPDATTSQATPAATPDPTTLPVTSAPPDATVHSTDSPGVASTLAVQQVTDPTTHNTDSPYVTSTSAAQQVTNPGQTTSCPPEWSHGVYFVLTDDHHTIHDTDVIVNTAARSRLACSMLCLHQPNCAFFAFNDETVACSLGGGIYAASKVQGQEGSTVFKRL